MNDKKKKKETKARKGTNTHDMQSAGGSAVRTALARILGSISCDASMLHCPSLPDMKTKERKNSKDTSSCVLPRDGSSLPWSRDERLSF
jgi:hypothetical protein